MFQGCKVSGALQQGLHYTVRAELETDSAFGGIQVYENMQAYCYDVSLINGLYAM